MVYADKTLEKSRFFDVLITQIKGNKAFRAVVWSAPWLRIF